MTGLYKTEAERTFLNYYALMPLSNDQYAKTHRGSICAGSIAVAFATLGTYPLALGLCMSLEYLIERITQNLSNLADIILRMIQFFHQSLASEPTPEPTTPNIAINQQIDELADIIDQLISSKHKSLRDPIQSTTIDQQDNDLSLFPLDVQNLIMSKTGADLQQLKLGNLEYRKKTESASIRGFEWDLKELKNFLKNHKLVGEINTQFNKKIEKSLVFKTTDELTNLLLEQLTEDEINDLQRLPGFSLDFQDLLYINQKIKKFNEINTVHLRNMQNYLDSIMEMIEFLCEKEMFIKAFDVIKNTTKPFPKTRIDCLTLIFKKSIEKNRFAVTLKALEGLSTCNFTFDINAFVQFIEKLCAENRFGLALKAINRTKPYVVQVILSFFLCKLCNQGLVKEAKCAADLIILTQESKYLLLQESYLMIATKLCERNLFSEVLELQREYATKESDAHRQVGFLQHTIQMLADNNEYDSAKGLVNQLPDEQLRKDAISQIAIAYRKNNRANEDTWTSNAWQVGRC